VLTTPDRARNVCDMTMNGTQTMTATQTARLARIRERASLHVHRLNAADRWLRANGLITIESVHTAQPRNSATISYLLRPV
jgi:hypothetical protein